ncbi:hypothetical protein MTBLM1_70233 [Rhodospirillaceae bacterium LM-1]|nr:hypothetical protein MTBLM1_70233 [Rhodospirillaceae bacterium LM-1]
MTILSFCLVPRLAMFADLNTRQWNFILLRLRQHKNQNVLSVCYEKTMKLIYNFNGLWMAQFFTNQLLYH